MAVRGGFRSVVLIAGVLAASSGMTGLAVARPATSVPRCFGKAATIYAPGSNRHVVGTKHNDVIVAMGAGDVISGGAGNDLICAGAAKSIDGGAGNDKISFSGNGTAHGGTGNDTIILGKGNGTAYGDAGNDVLTAGAGKQHLHGGAGNDRLTGGTKGTYILDGDAGNDVLVVKGAHTTLDGGAGVDDLIVPPKYASTTVTLDDVGDRLNGKPQTQAKTTVTAPLPGQPAVPPAPAPTPAPEPTPGPALAASLTYDGVPGPADIAADPDGADSITVGFGLVLPTGDAIDSWTVAWGDGGSRSGTGLPPVAAPHKYAGPGTFTALLTLVDSEGTRATSSLQVDAAPEPSITRLLPLTVIGQTATVDLSSARTPGASVSELDLDWGDGELDPLTAVPHFASHHYARAGSYLILANLLNDHAGLAQGQAQVDIDASEPHANLVYQAPTVTGGLTGFIPTGPVLKVATHQPILLGSETSIGSATFDYGDGRPESAYISQEDTYDTPGVYHASLTEYLNNKSDTADIEIDVVPATTFSGPAVPATVAVGQVISATSSVKVGTGDHVVASGFDWGDGTAPTISTSGFLASASHTYAAAGAYQLKSWAVTDHGEYSLNGFVNEVVTAPTATATLSGYGSSGWDSRWVGAVRGASVGFLVTAIPATGEGFDSYDVNYGEGPDDSGVLSPQDLDISTADYFSGPRHVFTTLGSHTVTLTLHDTAGATVVRTLHIDVAEPSTLTADVTTSLAKGTATATVHVTTGAGETPDSFLYIAQTTTQDPHVPGETDQVRNVTPGIGEGPGTPPETLSFTIDGAHAGDHFTLDVEYATDHDWQEENIDVPL